MDMNEELKAIRSDSVEQRDAIRFDGSGSPSSAICYRIG
jgi:hypothetical protein